MLGAIVSVRKVGNRVVVTNRPRRTLGKLTERQEAHQEKFLEAAQYASRQIVPEEGRVLYAGGVTGKKRTPYLVAMCDFLVPPKVAHIDTLEYRGAIGDLITVKAKDDFMVTKVKLVITDAAGEVIEEGDASEHPALTSLWVYAITAANPNLSGTTIRAVAYDRPGNTGTAQVVL